MQTLVCGLRIFEVEALCHLLCCMFFFKVHYSCRLSTVHIPGVLNDRAVDLSRNRLSSFFSKFLGADCLSTLILVSFMLLLELQTLDWTSLDWIQQFTVYVKRAQPRRHSIFIEQLFRDIPLSVWHIQLPGSFI